tara:strand:+ start:60 stop:257 length:198 start_codon:yes stop_codon:yes gene_type:complete
VCDFEDDISELVVVVVVREDIVVIVVISRERFSLIFWGKIRGKENLKRGQKKATQILKRVHARQT